jgi:hypothetical protein
MRIKERLAAIGASWRQGDLSSRPTLFKAVAGTGNTGIFSIDRKIHSEIGSVAETKLEPGFGVHILINNRPP